MKLLQEILIWGIFAMSLDLLMGYAGMVSFGHSAFFGIGGYVAALALATEPGAGLGRSLLPALAAGLAALVIGFFSIRVSGVYFIMLTLAFSQMFYAYAFQVSWLGAEDGLVGDPAPGGARAWTSASLRGFHAYLLALVALGRARALARRPLAVRPRAARHPRERGAHGGGGLRGGPLQAARLRASRASSRAWPARSTPSSTARSRPDAFFWKTSGEALLMVIIGGTGTLGGAVLGAAAFILLQSLVSTYTERWMLILGATFILFVLFAPGGIVGALRGRIGLRA